MKLGVLTTALAVFLLAGFPFAATAGPSPDMDSDGTIDVFDVCSDDPAVPSLIACDEDKDGFGNGCDCDFNNDGPCNSTDTGEFILSLTAPVGTHDPNHDLNCDGVMNSTDTGIFVALLLGAMESGPSGLPCAGTVPCHP